MTYQVNEIFTSIQGEGILAGSPATFIRLQGCTVGCPWCDTKYTWKRGGRRMQVDEILAQVDPKVAIVVITGGEPTLYNLDDLLDALRGKYYVQLETSGQNNLKGVLLPNLITWSPKPALDWSAPDFYYENAGEIKFVVEPQLTDDKIRQILYRAKTPFVSFMPEGLKPENIERALALAREYARLPWRAIYSDRLQFRLGVR